MRRGMRLRAMVSFAGQREGFELPTANMIGWWSADSLTGLADGDQVTLWSDLSGTGNDLDTNAGAGPAYWPRYVATDPLFNNKPSVSFNGAQWILKTGAPIGMPTGNTSVTVYTVAYYRSSSTKIVWYWGSTLAGYNGASVGFSSHPFSPHSLLINNNGITWGALANPINDSFVAAWAHIAGSDVLSSPMYLNGVTGTSVVTGTSGLLNMTPVPNWTISFGLYGSSGGPLDFDGNIAEVIVYSEAHSVETIQDISEYLMQKYAVA